jgi:hypothetical protein
MSGIPSGTAGDEYFTVPTYFGEYVHYMWWHLAAYRRGDVLIFALFECGVCKWDLESIILVLTAYSHREVVLYFHSFVCTWTHDTIYRCIDIDFFFWLYILNYQTNKSSFTPLSIGRFNPFREASEQLFNIWSL